MHTSHTWQGQKVGGPGSGRLRTMDTPAAISTGIASRQLGSAAGTRGIASLECTSVQLRRTSEAREAPDDDARVEQPERAGEVLVKIHDSQPESSGPPSSP